MPSRIKTAARWTVCQASFARVAPRARRASNAKTTETPTTKTKVGKTRSVGVRPFHVAWFIKRHEPGPPLLFTMIMKAMVMPRTTSREIRRLTGLRAGAGMVVAIGIDAVAGFDIEVRASTQQALLHPTLRGSGGFRQVQF